MRVLVTGGAGYIGSHACKRLAECGHEPITYDNLSRGHADAVQWGPLEEGDLLDGERLAGVLRKHTIEAVMHFAALALVEESVRRPDLYYRNNLVGSLHLLDAMRQTGVGTLIFSSTCATYGLPSGDLLAEDHPQQPINPYGRSKLMVEGALADYSRAGDLGYLALRYFNAAGSDPAGQIGERHDPETHLIPNVLRAIRGELTELTVFGSDYPTPDGTCIRDYVHVEDLASAHCLALEKLSSGTLPSGAMNLGLGRGRSIREVLHSAERVTGRRVPVRYGPRRPGDPPRLVAASHRAVTELGWQPRYTDLDQMISHAWEWQRKDSKR